jgi:hypothetical protein
VVGDARAAGQEVPGERPVLTLTQEWLNGSVLTVASLHQMDSIIDKLAARDGI